MNVRGRDFSCQIPLSLVQRAAVAVKPVFPQPAESRAKMLHPNSSSLFARVAHASGFFAVLLLLPLIHAVS